MQPCVHIQKGFIGRFYDKLQHLALSKVSHTCRLIHCTSCYLLLLMNCHLTDCFFNVLFCSDRSFELCDLVLLLYLLPLEMHALPSGLVVSISLQQLCNTKSTTLHFLNLFKMWVQFLFSVLI